VFSVARHRSRTSSAASWATLQRCHPRTLQRWHTRHTTHDTRSQDFYCHIESRLEHINKRRRSSTRSQDFFCHIERLEHINKRRRSSTRSQDFFCRHSVKPVHKFWELSALVYCRMAQNASIVGLFCSAVGLFCLYSALVYCRMAQNAVLRVI
jgi:hypothetical protein